MRVGNRIKRFFGRIGKGIKTGAKFLYDKGRSAVSKVAEYAPKIINVAKKVVSALPGGKYTDIAKKVVDKSDEAYKKGKELYDKGKKVAEVIKGGE